MAFAKIVNIKIIKTEISTKYILSCDDLDLIKTKKEASSGMKEIRINRTLKK
jgi:hypothetical protein